MFFQQVRYMDKLAVGLYHDSKNWFEKAIDQGSKYVIAKEALEDVNIVIDILRKNKLKLIKNNKK